MALGDLYVSVEELATYVQTTTVTSSEQLLAVSRATQDRIEAYTSRQYNDAGSVSARVFAPSSSGIVNCDDFSTDTGLIVKLDSTNTGTFGTTLASTDYYLEPLNGVSSGQTGWPYKRVVMRNRRLTAGPSVEITARWGWAAVPSAIIEAVKIQAASVLDRRNSPNGVIGTGDFVFEVRRAKLDPTAMMLLAPYVKSELLVA